MYNSFCNTAKRRNVLVDITFDMFLTFVKINECYYCGNEVQWSKFRKNQESFRYNLDRKDNSKNYSLDNCVVCCKRCNYIKNTLGHDEFIELCKIIAKRHNNEKVYEQPSNVFGKTNEQSNNFDFTKSNVSNETRCFKDTCYTQ